DRWINRQILLSRASGDNLLDRKALSSKMARFSSSLELQLYLDSLTRHSFNPTEGDLLAYYNDHPEFFTFQRESARIVMASFIKFEEASAALRQLRASSNRDSVLAFFNYDHMLIARDQLIPELNEAIFSAQPGNIIGPVFSEFGYHLVMVESHYSQGAKIPFEIALDQVTERLLQIQIQSIHISIIDSLSETLDVEVRPR
ncbi:MAG: peptidyl-prolyl cis-trans isomerase, partial [Candidatus Marinimicrobia bacterium]|nr:peptidyl-prolyl cis-trans isomerase [Candidatus Neomarinimicrobiota bacterium]